MYRLLTCLIGVSLTIFSLTGTSAVADHMPNKMMRNFLAWSRLGDTGVLNWAIEGCLDWQEQGLNPPQIVQDQLDHY